MRLKRTGVSVIVCCYNSAVRLPETIKHLALQKVSDNISWEIIIVDNASNDNTAQIASKEFNKYGCRCTNFQVVSQPIAGLSFAREMGIKASTYDCLIFCDDDNWLDENYVENAFNLLQLWPGSGIIGGFGMAKPEIAPPGWFDVYSGYYATGPQNTHNGVIEGDCPYVYGAGAVVRKSVLNELDDLGFKPVATDRLTDTLSSGGDVELSYAIKLIGYDVAYSSELKFVHFIQRNRLTDKYLLQLVYHFGYCNILHRPYYWVFNPELPSFKKTWIWTLIISLNIYLISFFNQLKKGNSLKKFISKVNISQAKGRLAAILKLNSEIETAYLTVGRKFNKVPRL